MTASSASLGDAASYGFDDPRLYRLLSYWNSIRPAGGVPSRRTIDPVDIFRLLPNIWICDYEVGLDTFRYRLAGEDVSAPYGRNLKGLTVADLFDGDRYVYANTQMKRVALDRCITLVSGFVLWNVDRYQSGERLILPLSTDGTPGILAITIADSTTPSEMADIGQLPTVRTFPIPD